MSMEQSIESQSIIKSPSTIGSIFICMGFLFFYIAIKCMVIPLEAIYPFPEATKVGSISFSARF